MPHISKRKPDAKTVADLENYLLSIMNKAGSKTRLRIFGELLTETEKIMLAKRLAIIFLVRKGLSPYKISELLKISPSTVERFEKSIEFGRYKNTSDWLWKNSKEGSFEALLESIVKLAFTGKTKSFKKFIDEF